MSQIYKKFTFTWIIKNYSFFALSGGSGFSIFSPNFTAENIDKTKWRMVLFAVQDGSEEYISLQLNRLWKDMIQVIDTESEKQVPLDFEIELCSAVNEVFYVTKKKKVSSQLGDYYPFQKVLLKEELERKMKETCIDILILRCRMGSNLESVNSEIPLDLSCTVKTTKCLDELFYRRQLCCFKYTNYINQLTFPINNNMQLKVLTKVHKDDILFKITQDKVNLFQKIECEITLLDEEGAERISCSDCFIFSNNFRIWHFPPFLQRSLFKSETRSLYFKFKFTFANGLVFREDIDETKLKKLSSSHSSQRNVSAYSVTHDLRKMLFNKEFSDVSFCVGNEIIRAHKFILASRSPVFSAMLHQKMVDNQTGVIDISDMDLQTLKLFLEFLYTGDFPGSDCERTLKLLLAAEKYQVPTLKQKCSHLLKHLLSLENVCDVVSVANTVCDLILKEAATNFIRENVSKVLRSSKWSTFSEKNPKLCLEIFQIVTDEITNKI